MVVHSYSIRYFIEATVYFCTSMNRMHIGQDYLLTPLGVLVPKKKSSRRVDYKWIYSKATFLF